MTHPREVPLLPVHSSPHQSYQKAVAPDSPPAYLEMSHPLVAVLQVRLSALQLDGRGQLLFCKFLSFCSTANLNT